ncbi:MAG: 2-isopropylmalate synthase, partial [Paracoccaceae bacterium]
YANGDIYSGAFRGGRRHGQGILTLADGVKFAGLWDNGELIEPAAQNTPSQPAEPQSDAPNTPTEPAEN